MTADSKDYLLQILLMSQCSFYFLKRRNQIMISMQSLEVVHNKRQSRITSKTTFICQFSREFNKSKNNKCSMGNCKFHYNAFCPVFDTAEIVCHYL